jgi:hypothetical protein
MSISPFTQSVRRHDTGISSPDVVRNDTSVRALFARLRQRFGVAYESAWARSPEPEHLLAYAIWSEALTDSEQR